jgi:hypothetical protein
MEVRAQLGCGNGLVYLASRGIQILSKGRVRILKYYFVAQPVLNAPLVAPMPNASVQIAKAHPDDPIVRQFPRPRAVVARRFAEGAHCFVARKGERFIGFLWIQVGECLEDLDDDVRCFYQLEPSGAAAWDFDVYVDSQYRFSRVFVRLWDEANGFLREAGCRWSLSHISAFNPISITSHKRFGMQVLHTGMFFQLGSSQLAVLTCAPFVHFARRPSKRLVLRLCAPGADAHPFRRSQI